MTLEIQYTDLDTRTLEITTFFSSTYEGLYAQFRNLHTKLNAHVDAWSFIDDDGNFGGNQTPNAGAYLFEFLEEKL